MAIYQSLGTWNAVTNTPALPAVTSAPTNTLPTPDGNHYDYYIVSTSGSTAETQINVNASAGTFTRLTGSFTTDGLANGQTIVTSGFSNGGNNATKVINTVTALVVTVTNNSGLVDETGSGNEQVRARFSHTNAEANQVYATGDSVVAIPGTLTWTKNPANPAGGQIVLQEIDRPASGVEGFTIDRIIKPSQSFGAPVIVPPLDGQTTVSGTAAFGATIRVTIESVPYTGVITSGAWSVAVPVLMYGQSVTAVAILFGGVETQSASVIVGRADVRLPPHRNWAYGRKLL